MESSLNASFAERLDFLIQHISFNAERMKRIRQISGRQTAVLYNRHIGGNIPILGRLYVSSIERSEKAFVLSFSCFIKSAMVW